METSGSNLLEFSGLTFTFLLDHHTSGKDQRSEACPTRTARPRVVTAVLPGQLVPPPLITEPHLPEKDEEHLTYVIEKKIYRWAFSQALPRRRSVLNPLY